MADLGSASDTLARALILNGRAALDATRRLAENILRGKENLRRNDHDEIVPSLLNLSEILVAHTEFERAIAIARRAVLRSERNGSGASPEALDRLGSALAAAGRHEDALLILERGLRIKESLPDKNDAGIAWTLEEIGLALQRKGEYRTRRPAAATSTGDTRSDEH